jgi:glyoxylase-like metal-dependent hydrolase (beta-lactamase superfamily II)
MRHRLTWFVCALCAVAAVPLRAQVNYDTVQVRSTPLAPGVYELTGSGGNIGLFVGNDAVFVIDDQFAPLTPKILAAIAAITPRPVRFVVNTHWHFDHTGGNENLGNIGAVIFAHENVRKRMSTDQFIEALNRQQPASPPGALPLVTFAEGVTFHINGDSVVVTHIPPGHTDGDAIIHFTRANVIHGGDDFNNAGLPFVDLSSGGSINGIITAAEKIVALSNAQTKIIPGHGAVADRARVQAYHDVLVALKAKMAAEVKAKKTLEQVLADSISKPYLKEWPAGHDRFVRLLYQEMTRK